MHENGIDIRPPIYQNPKPMIHYLPILTLAACIAPAAAAESNAWMTDLDAAKKKAAAENKAVLVEFSGSDWCSYSRNLRKKIMTKPEFLKYAGDKYVLVNIDFPRKTKLPAEQARKNEAWSKEYNVDGFPTVLVLDPDGAAYGGFSGGLPDFAAVKTPLEEAYRDMKNAKAAIAVANKLSGDDKILILQQIYKAVPEEYRVSRAALLKNIIDLDKKDLTGLVAKTNKENEIKALKKRIQDEIDPEKPAAETLPKIDAILAEPKLPEEGRLALLQIKLQLMLQDASSEEEIDRALTVINDIVKVRPELSAQLQQLKKQIQDNKDELLESNKDRKDARKK